MKQLRKEIEPLARDTYEQKALLYFNALAWIDSKISNLPLEDILKRKRPAKKEKVTV